MNPVKIDNQCSVCGKAHWPACNASFQPTTPVEREQAESLKVEEKSAVRDEVQVPAWMPVARLAASTLIVAPVADEQDRYLLLRSRKRGLGELPGGKFELKRDESLADCAYREAVEETGLPITRSMPLIGLYTNPTADGQILVFAIFRAVVATKKGVPTGARKVANGKKYKWPPEPTLSSEHDHYNWVTYVQMRDAALQGRLSPRLTQLALDGLRPTEVHERNVTTEDWYKGEAPHVGFPPREG